MERSRHSLGSPSSYHCPLMLYFLAQPLERFLPCHRSCHTAQVPAMALCCTLSKAKVLLMLSRFFMTSQVPFPLWPNLLLLSLHCSIHMCFLALSWTRDVHGDLDIWSWLFLGFQMLFPKYMNGLPPYSFKSLFKNHLLMRRFLTNLFKIAGTNLPLLPSSLGAPSPVWFYSMAHVTCHFFMH